MADIVESLFGLAPIRQQVDLYNRAQDLDLGTLMGQAFVNTNAPIAKQQAYVAKQGAQAALAGAAVRGLGGLFGLQDPMLKRATGLESILQTTQMDLGEEANNPAVFYPELQKRLAESGFTREALQVGQVAQKAIQDYGLTQAKLMTERAQLAKATQEKLGTFAQTLLAAGFTPGSPEWNAEMRAKIDKETYIPEKTLTPQNEAEKDVLAGYRKMYPDNPELASKAFMEYKSNLRQKEAAAGVPAGQTPAVDISRLDNSFKEFVLPNKEKLGSINEALKLAEQALTNPQAGVQLNALLASLYQGGRLSNQDINRTANPGSLPAQVIQNFNKIISGVDTETNIADKVKLLKSLQEGTANSLNSSVDAWAERWGTAPGVSKETIDTYTKGAKFRKKEANKPKTAEEYLKGL